MWIKQCGDEIMVALTGCDISHNVDTDEIILRHIINNDTVVGVTARGNRGVHFTGDHPVPLKKMMQDAVVVLISVCIQITKQDGITGWCPDERFQGG